MSTLGIRETEADLRNKISSGRIHRGFLDPMSNRNGRYVATLGGLIAASLVAANALAAEQPGPDRPAASHVQNVDRKDAPEQQEGDPSSRNELVLCAGTEKKKCTKDADSEPKVQRSWWQRAWSEPGDVFNAVIAICTVILAFIGLWQAAIARGTARRQLRAYCGPSEFKFVMPHLGNQNFKSPDPRPPNYVISDYIVVTIKNFGLTPAFDVSLLVNWQTFLPFGAEIPHGFAFPDQREDLDFKNKSVVDPGRELPAIIPEAEHDLDLFRQAKARKCSLYLYGSVFYSDAFRRRWARTFCVVWEPWNPEGLQFVPMHSYSSESRA